MTNLLRIFLILSLVLVSSFAPALGDIAAHEDPELLNAMEIFAGMSPDEMEETVKQLMESVGDDPETQAELAKILEQLPKMRAENNAKAESSSSSNLEQMVADDEVAAATQDALQLLAGSNWEMLWEMQADVLEAVLASGHLTAEDAALFRTDNAAWKTQLRFIWDTLQEQAAAQEGEL